MKVASHWRKQKWMYRLEVSETSGAPHSMWQYVGRRGIEGGGGQVEPESSSETSPPSEVDITLVQAELGLAHEVTPDTDEPSAA
jgi:hypothetical protein